MARSLTPEQVVALLEESPQRIEAVTADLSPAQLRAAPEPGEWSAVELLAHLRSCGDVWGDCIAQILAADHPTIRAVNPTTWINDTDYPTLEFAPSWSAYRTQRDGLLSTLRELSARDWVRAAKVTGGGKARERTVLFYAEWLATHERGHVRQFAKIAKTLQS